MRDIAKGTPLTDDRELEEELAVLLDRALRRQSWFFFLDADSALAGPVMPCAEHPPTPDEPISTPDLGIRSWSETIALRFTEVMRQVGLSQIVIVWERPGASGITEADREWARAFGADFATAGARVRAQFVLHDDGLRQLAPDDLIVNVSERGGTVGE